MQCWSWGSGLSVVCGPEGYPSFHLFIPSCVLLLVVTALVFMSFPLSLPVPVAMRVVQENCDSLGAIGRTPPWRPARCLALRTFYKRSISIELRWPCQLSRFLHFIEMFSRTVWWASEAPQCAIRDSRGRAIVKIQAQDVTCLRCCLVLV